MNILATEMRIPGTGYRSVEEDDKYWDYSDKDHQIRSIAHRIWEEEGRPNGRHLEHWRKAEEIWQEQNR